METGDLIEAAEKASKAFELAKVTTLKGYRDDEAGHTREVTIEIHDMGPSRPHIRYSVIARDDHGRAATGNPDSTVELALQMVHWSDLDRDNGPLSFGKVTEQAER